MIDTCKREGGQYSFVLTQGNGVAHTRHTRKILNHPFYEMHIIQVKKSIETKNPTWGLAKISRGGGQSFLERKEGSRVWLATKFAACSHHL